AESSIVKEWLREFLPLFRSWLTEYVGREVGIKEFVAQPMSVGTLREHVNEMSATGVAIVILSRAYAALVARGDELRTVYRTLGPDRVVAITLDREFQPSGSEWRDLRVNDFSRFAI